MCVCVCHTYLRIYMSHIYVIYNVIYICVLTFVDYRERKAIFTKLRRSNKALSGSSSLKKTRFFTDLMNIFLTFI